MKRVYTFVFVVFLLISELSSCAEQGTTSCSTTPSQIPVAGRWKSVTWASGGTGLLLVSLGLGGEPSELKAYDFETQILQRLGESFPAWQKKILAASWSQSGQYIACATSEGVVKITKADGATLGITFTGSEIAWSPRDNNILMVAGTQKVGPDERKVSVFICEVDSGYCTGLWEKTGKDIGILQGIDWSSSGDSIILSLEEREQADLYLINIDSVALTRLTSTQETNEVFPTWSPDGHWIVFNQCSVESGHCNIVLASAQLDRVSSILESSVGSLGAHSWSPINNQLVYTDKGKIFTLDIGAVLEKLETE